MRTVPTSRRRSVSGRSPVCSRTTSSSSPKCSHVDRAAGSFRRPTMASTTRPSMPWPSPGKRSSVATAPKPCRWAKASTAPRTGITASASPCIRCVRAAAWAMRGGRAKRPDSAITRAAGEFSSCVDSSDMIAPCEKPISVVPAGATAQASCHWLTACTNPGIAAATRAGRLVSVTPWTENHCQPGPEASGACTLAITASGRCGASASPNGARSRALEPTPWNSRTSWRGVAGRWMMRSCVVMGSSPIRPCRTRRSPSTAHRG